MKIAILDFESRFTEDVENAFDKLNVEKHLFRHDVTVKEIEDYDALVFTGSKDTVYKQGRLPDKDMINCNKPILGICYGHQLVHYLLGGEVRRSKTPEHNIVEIEVEQDSKLFKSLPRIQKVEMHHDDEVVKLADGFRCIASESNCIYGASENVDKKIYTVQFHPEAEGNDYGLEIFNNFVEIVKENNSIKI